MNIMPTVSKKTTQKPRVTRWEAGAIQFYFLWASVYVEEVTMLVRTSPTIYFQKQSVIRVTSKILKVIVKRRFQNKGLCFQTLSQFYCGGGNHF